MTTAADWAGTTPALPYRSTYARVGIQMPFASGNGELDAPEYLWGNGPPQGLLTGDQGDVYVQRDSVTGVVLWQKTTNGGNTGWVPVLANGSVAALQALTVNVGPVILGGDPGGNQLLRVGGASVFAGQITTKSGITAGGDIIPDGLGGRQIGNATLPFLNGIYGTPIDSGTGNDLNIRRAGVTYLYGGAAGLSLVASVSFSNGVVGQLLLTPTLGGPGFVVGNLTQTTSQPVLSLAQQWNAAGVAFTGILVNITPQASAAGSKFLDIQASGNSFLYLANDGSLNLNAVSPVGTGSFLNFLVNGANAGYIQKLGGNPDLSIVAVHQLVFSVNNNVGGNTDWTISPSGKLKFSGNSGGLVIASSAFGTAQTSGFFYLPTCAGTPTGVPTTETGQAAMIFDSTNNFLYIYNGSWKKTTVFA